MVDFTERTIAGITYLERPPKGDAEGPVLILLHGIGSNANSFQGILARLPSHMRVIAWNMPGYGGSCPLDDTRPVARDYALALLHFLDALNLSRVALLGHSLGTLVAAATAELAPKRVDSVILASSAQGYGVLPGEKMPSHVAARIKELEVMGAAAFAKARAPRLVFEPVLNPKVVATVETAMSQVDRAGYAQAVRMLAAGDLAASLVRGRTRARFIVGINDRVTPEQQTLVIAEACRKATGHPPEISRIDQVGHAIYQQKPDEFSAIVTRILAEPDSKRDRK